jgi:hypothetical protein
VSGGNHAAFELDARSDVGVDEVQRHLHVDLVGGVDALEIQVQHLLLVRVPLGVLQDHGLGGTVEHHAQHGRVEGFVAQGVVDLVVIDFDLGGAPPPKTMAGTLPARRRRRLALEPCTNARLGVELNGHALLQFKPVRDQTRREKAGGRTHRLET